MQLPTWTLALIASSAPLIQAHTRFTTLFVDGISQGDGSCVRMDMDASKTTNPVGDITSNDITCGIGGLDSVALTCPVTVGSTVSFQYRMHADGSSPGSIVQGHSGPCAIYMKKISSDPLSETFPTTWPTGDGWFKIMYEDHDQASGQWCTDRLSESSEGIISAVIPSDLSSGYYLLRPELLALHNADKGDPQFYTGCAQVYITGGSGTAEPETVSIPGYVNYGMPAMRFSLYTNPLALPYPSFGPSVYKASSGSKLLARTPDPEPQPEAEPNTNIDLTSRSNTIITDLAPRDSTTGVVGCPNNTILQVSNWCGQELPSYSDTSSAMTNCWATAKKCWDEGETCWASFSPAVNNDAGKGCALWTSRCEEIDNACLANVMSGPPNQGKVRTPAPVYLDGYGIMKAKKREVEIKRMVRVHRAGRMRRGME